MSDLVFNILFVTIMGVVVSANMYIAYKIGQLNTKRPTRIIVIKDSPKCLTEVKFDVEETNWQELKAENV